MTKTTVVEKVINGVNVEAVENAVKALTDQPDLAKFRFRLKNRWINGGHNQSTVG